MSMTETAKTQTTIPAGTQVQVTRGTYKGRTGTVHAVVGQTHIVTGVPTYLKATSLKVL